MKKNKEMQSFKSSNLPTKIKSFSHFKQNITYNKTLHIKSKTKANGKNEGLGMVPPRLESTTTKLTIMTTCKNVSCKP